MPTFELCNRFLSGAERVGLNNIKSAVRESLEGVIQDRICSAIELHTFLLEYPDENEIKKREKFENHYKETSSWNTRKWILNNLERILVKKLDFNPYPSDDSTINLLVKELYWVIDELVVLNTAFLDNESVRWKDVIDTVCNLLLADIYLMDEYASEISIIDTFAQCGLINS